jgi:hypothetical protein
LVGLCVWDVFSDNHEGVGRAGRLVDLGSFRATGGFLADYLNALIGRAEYDYLNFYLGTIRVAQRADLTSVYRMPRRPRGNLPLTTGLGRNERAQAP